MKTVEKLVEGIYKLIDDADSDHWAYSQESVDNARVGVRDLIRIYRIDTVDKTIEWLLKYGYCDADVYTELDRRELLKDIEG